MSNKYREGELSKLTRRVFYMDLELLKKVVKRVSPLTTTATKIKIEGYTDDEVNQMIQKLIDAGIVTKQKGKKYGVSVAMSAAGRKPVRERGGFPLYQR